MVPLASNEGELRVPGEEQASAASAAGTVGSREACPKLRTRGAPNPSISAGETRADGTRQAPTPGTLLGKPRRRGPRLARNAETQNGGVGGFSEFYLTLKALYHFH